MSDPILAEAIGPIDGSNVDFNTPVAYIPGSLFAYLNGILVQQSGTEGPIELLGTSVRMREAPRVGDTLHFYFDTSLQIPGAFVVPPAMMSGLNLAPEIRASINLHPQQISATDETSTGVEPDMMSATELTPDNI